MTRRTPLRYLTPRIIYLTAVVLFLVDRALKWLALRGWRGGADGIATFELFRNRGIAFSIPLPDVAFWPLACLVFAGLLVLLIRATRANAAAAPFLILIVLGAASNLIDRLTHGAITDYLIFFGRSAVNLADGMIAGGVFAVLAASCKMRITKKR